MYKPFVRAFNSALDELSGIHVDGLPQFEPWRQIVFVHSSNQPIKSPHLWRDSQAKPEIVLLQWNLFAERLSRRDGLVGKVPYSESYSGKSCLSASGLDLSWRAVRSTVEMKFKGLPNPIELPVSSDKKFKDLKETPPYAPLVDPVRTIVLPHEGPMNSCECVVS